MPNLLRKFRYKAQPVNAAFFEGGPKAARRIHAMLPDDTRLLDRLYLLNGRTSMIAIEPGSYLLWGDHKYRSVFVLTKSEFERSYEAVPSAPEEIL